MTKSDEAIFINIISELDASTENTCALQIRKVQEQLVKLARNHWLSKGKEDLWHRAHSVWKDLENRIDQKARDADPDSRLTRDYFRAKDYLEITDLGFLAELFIQGSLMEQQQNVVDFERLLLAAKAERSPVYLAILHFNELLGLTPRPNIPIERPPLFEIVPDSDYDLPTLTSRRSGLGSSDAGILSVQVSFHEPPDPEPPDLHELMLNVDNGDENAILEIFKKFDKTQSPRVKNACIEALRLIGGCRVAQELSDRVANNPLYVQCLVLCALDGLASQPYRSSNGGDESLWLQRQTVLMVLNRLLEYEPHSADLRAIRDCAIEGVERHKSACGAG